MADEPKKDNITAMLTDVARAMNSHFKLDVALPGTMRSLSDVKGWIPTSSTLLNLLFGEENFGVPIGRIMEIFGDFSHGKSTVAQHIMNGFQKAGGLSVLLDSESGWNREHAVAIGHDPTRHLQLEVETTEMGFQAIYNLLEQFNMKFGGKIPIVIVWDTIAASPTNGEKKGDEYESGMMYKARLIRQELRRVVMELPKNNATLVFINQTIEGPKENKSGIKSTPGGGGIKFFSSQRLQITRVGKFSDWGGSSDKTVGIISEAKMVKNKLGPPGKKADLPLSFSVGIDPLREVYNFLLDNSNVVNISGAYKKIIGGPGGDQSFYEKNILTVLEKNPGLLDYMKEQTKMAWLGLEAGTGED